MVGNPNLPYINSLINHPKAAVMTQSYALTRPSQPNYFMLFAGTDMNVAHNWVPANTPYSSPNIAASLRTNGYSFIGYAEDLPAIGSLDSVSGHYVRKHNPWVNWQGNGPNQLPDTCNRPFTYFPKNNFSRLPTFSIVVPNQMNDMHSGPIQRADKWISDSLSAYVEWCVNNNSLFILTFDEDNNSGLFNNQILTLFIGANTIGGFYNQRVSHYNVLRTLEEVYSLPYSGNSADSSAIPGIWSTVLSSPLSRFDGIADGGEVRLNWEVPAGSSISSFAIERAINENQYQTIATLPASGLVYRYDDKLAVDGRNLYRLKMVMRNNTDRYSKTIAVTTKSGFDQVFNLSPNPTRDVMTIVSKRQTLRQATVELLDGSGQIVKKQLEQFIPRHPVNLQMGTLPAGTYYVRIYSDGKYFVKRVQKATL